MMSGQRYEQATSEESTELVTNRASLNPRHWNPGINYEEHTHPSFASQTSENLASNFSGLHVSSHGSGDVAASHYPQLSSRTATAFPNVQNASHGAQNTEVTATRQTDQHLKVEKNRLDTFNGSWPRNSVVQPRDLAKAGFYYLGPADVVRCVFCHISLRSWEPGDVPLDEHRKHSPSCPFILQHDVGNVPLQNARRQSPSETFPLEWRNMFRARQEPVYPEYGAVYNRLRSFAGRPVPAGQTADALANAGFFYIGPDDHVRCFSCGGSLKAWQPADHPVGEHLRWFPDCKFIQQQQQFPSQTQPFLSEETPSISESSQLHHPVTASSEGNDESIVMSQPLEEEMEPDPNPSRSETIGILHSTQEQLQQTGESKDMESLKEENRRLKDTMLCKVCMEKDISTLFLPCSHLVCCDDCAPSLRDCPICRTAIRGTVRTYIS